MLIDEYVNLANKTDLESYEKPIKRLAFSANPDINLEELILVIQQLDVYKKKIMYGKDMQEDEVVTTNLNLKSERQLRLFHGIIGIITEAGELLEALAKNSKGEELDEVNVAEELGDVTWYCALVAKELGVSYEAQLEKNIAKLKARYGEKFTEESAINRDLETERTILENQ